MGRKIWFVPGRAHPPTFRAMSSMAFPRPPLRHPCCHSSIHPCSTPPSSSIHPCSTPPSQFTIWALILPPTHPHLHHPLAHPPPTHLPTQPKAKMAATRARACARARVRTHVRGRARAGARARARTFTESKSRPQKTTKSTAQHMKKPSVVKSNHNAG